MKVFISWSGKNTASFKVAKKLAEWLPMVLQETEPFMSDNIRSGTNAISQIMENLTNSKMGIICVTKDNITSPWLNFEAGALNNVVTNQSGIVIPILINMTTDEFANSNSPIKNLQGKEFNNEDFKIVLQDINSCLESPISEKSLNSLYSRLEQDLFDIDLKDLPKEQTIQFHNIVAKIIEEKEEEKPYFSLLREIVNKFNSNGRRPVFYEADEVDKNNMYILSSMGYIKITTYINGSATVKPTGSGLQYVIDNPLE